MAKTEVVQNARRQDPTALGRNFKRRLRAGEVMLGGSVAEYLRPSLAKIYAQAGYDFIYVDKEHMFFDGSEMTDFILAARDNQVPVISKIGELNRSETARLLEAGAVGIQLPRSESRAQLEELISYMKFPPKGTRAGAPCYGNVDYAWPADDRRWLRRADESTAVVVHIETVLGYEKAEEIVSTPQVDMVYVGPYDFSIAMGEPGNYDHPRVRKALLDILKRCKKHGVAFGTSASSPERGREWIAKGCQFFELATEQALIISGAAELVRAYGKGK